MKILVVCQHYYPEPFRITDVCEQLVKAGNQVTVLTGTPNYPMGKIYSGYENGQRAQEVLNGVNVIRLKTVPRKTGAINRLINYFSYAKQSKKYVKKLDCDFDVVLVNQLSPVMMAEAGLKYKRKYGTKVVLYCLDLWPESLCAGGIRKGSLVYRIFNKISAKIYRSVDKILVTSASFKQYFAEQFGIEEQLIEYLPQYAEEQFLQISPKEYTKEFRLLFAGNVGAAQSVDTIIDAARILKDEQVYFDIVGDGTELCAIKERAMGLDKVLFYGRQPLSEMPKYYQNADATLVTLVSDSFIASTLPGKVQTYMAAGRAIVGAADKEIYRVVNEAQGGYCGRARDAKQLADNILKLVRSNEAVQIGKKNRQYYKDNFAKERFVEHLTQTFESAKKE